MLITYGPGQIMAALTRMKNELAKNGVDRVIGERRTAPGRLAFLKANKRKYQVWRDHMEMLIEHYEDSKSFRAAKRKIPVPKEKVLNNDPKYDVL